MMDRHGKNHSEKSSKLSVSVAMCTFNGSAFVRQTLNAIFAQTLKPKEIIIVDDVSTDNTPDIIRELVCQSPVPIHFEQLQKNSGGPARPMNVAISHATSPVVALCEQDDTMLPQKLEMLIECLARDLGLGMVISRYRIMRKGHLKKGKSLLDDSYSAFESIDKQNLGGPYYRLDPRSAYLAAMEKCFVVGLSNMMIRKAHWSELGMLDEKIKRAADWDFLLRMSNRYPIGWVDEQLWEFHRHPQSLVENTSNSVWFNDFATIWRRQLKDLKNDQIRQRVKRKLHESLLGRAYSCKEEGHYRSSLASYLNHIFEMGPSLEAIKGIATLFPILRTM